MHAPRGAVHKKIGVKISRREEPSIPTSGRGTHYDTSLRAAGAVRPPRSHREFQAGNYKKRPIRPQDRDSSGKVRCARVYRVSRIRSQKNTPRRSCAPNRCAARVFRPHGCYRAAASRPRYVRDEERQPQRGSDSDGDGE